jgi:Flp pilus assembly protein TadG
MHRLLSLLGHRLQDERGAYVALTVVGLPLALVLVGLVVDGGLMFRSERRAVALTSAAAHAAAQQIDADLFKGTNLVTVNPGAAVGAAKSMFAYAPVDLKLEQVQVSGNYVTVHAMVSYSTIFLRVLGVPTINLRIASSAQPQYGIESLGQ